MKKLIAAVLAVLCLAACSAKDEPVQEVQVEPAPQTETVENPVDPTVEVPVQEVEIEIVPEEPLPEEPKPGEGGSVAVPVETVEGLVGDAVGYSLQQPVFTGYEADDAMNEFYAELIAGLEDYAKGYVNTHCLENNCIASVYGKVIGATLSGDTLTVTYECRVEFSVEEDSVVNVRTDVWNVITGEVEKQ